MKKIIGIILVSIMILQILSIFILPINAKFIEETNELFWQGNSKIKKEYNENKIQFKEYSHLLTREEMNQLKKHVGVYDKNKNYNVKYNELGTGLAPPSDEQWNVMVGTVNVVDNNLPNLPSATSIDLSIEPYFPIVRSQGSQGSCAAWAATYYANGYIQAKNNGWNEAGIGNNNHLLSPAFTYNKCNHGQDSGSHTWTNGYVMQDVGVCSWSEMPYNSGDYVNWGNENAWRDAQSYRISDIFMIDSYPANYDDSDINIIKNAVESGYPVTFALHASSYNYFGSDDVLGLNAMVTSYNHANTIVGYDDSIIDVESGEIGAFKCVNSWGSSCGPNNNGYYWMTYDAFKGSQNVYPVCWFGDLYTDSDPKLIGVWELNPQSDRDASIELGIGSYSSPLETRTPWWDGHSGIMHSYPSFMCLDITEFYDDWISGSNNFYLDFGNSLYNDGIISSFKIEYYDISYITGSPTRISLESGDVPQTTPGYVETQLSQTETEFPPDKPSIPNPNDGLNEVDIDPTLSVYVYDMDGDNMDVSFYTESDVFIGTDFNVASGSRASILWSDLSYDTLYSWYALADDGIFTNKSDIWFFTTTNQAQPDYFYANQDIIVQNKGITGSYMDTFSSDDNYEGIQERESGGKPSKRHSYLEHKWIIPVTGGLVSYTFCLEAHHTLNSEGDDFIFEYSMDDINYIPMITVLKTSDDDTCQMFTLPTSISGNIYIRVKDTDHTSGNRVLDTIYIDHMYILRSGTPPPNRTPYKPTDPDPSDGATGVDINPILSVYVYDLDGDFMNVSFYDEFGIIGTDNNVASGSRASISWPELSYEQTFGWYAIADDDEYTNTSDAWSFTTKGETPPGGMYVWNITWREKNAGPNTFLYYTVIIRWDSDGEGDAEETDELLSGATVYTTLSKIGTTTPWWHSGVTDANGQVEFGEKVGPGYYTAEVKDIVLSGYNYSSDLDRNNPSNHLIT